MVEGKEPKELKIEGEHKEDAAPERLTPDVEADFTALLQDYGVAEKAALVISKHIADTGSDRVFEKPRELLEKLAKFPRQIPPVTRKNVLDHWIAQNKIPIPEGYEEEAELPSEDLRQRRGKAEKEPEKYSVDTVTGAIRAAMTTDKMALTWDEAEKLSNTIKKELADKAKKGEKKVAYVYDTVDRVVRMAKEGEVGGTMEQAKELKKMAEEGGKGAEESPFMQGEDGNWILNPKARVTGVELMALDAIRRAQERGEPVDPLEALGQAAEKMKIYREALGSEGAVLPEWMRDPIAFQKTIQELAPKGEGDALKEVRDELTRVRDDLHQSELNRKDGQIADLTGVIQGYRGEVDRLRTQMESNRTGRSAYDLLGDLIKKVPDKEDIRQMVTEAVGKGAKLLPRGAGERERVLEKAATSIEAQAEVRSVENDWFRWS